MRAVVCDRPGDESVMRVADVPAPGPIGPRGIRIRVQTTALNRADLLQRRGLYPPTPGASDILGLECAGEVIEAGAEVDAIRPGDRVMALLPGGGYAEEVVADAGSAMPVPAQFTWDEAGAFCETFLTAYSNLFEIGGAGPSDTVLVHGGSGGVGTAALSICREAGVHAIVTAGGPDRCRRCVDLGAEVAIDHRAGDFAPRVREATGGRGVDVVLDCIGGKTLAANLDALTTGGRLVIIGLMGGAKSEIDLTLLMKKRLTVVGSTLRSRSVDDKAGLLSRFLARFGAALAAGRLRPVVDRVFSLDEVADAHRALGDGLVFGKVVLRVR
jgi:putative PIG3 family NAD(P)H quinone oxidoreductase